MNFKFWFIRFSIVFIVAFIVIAGAQFFKSQSAVYALTQGAIWASFTAIIYISVLIYKFRKNPVCFLRGDNPND